MKAMIKILFASATVFATLISSAQPVLTGNAINPTVGDVFNYTATDYVNPGDSGANKTWDLSMMASLGPLQKTVVSPSNTPSSSSFPSSNVCIVTQSYYEYCFANDSCYKSYGGYSGNGYPLVFNPAKVSLQYPFNYNTTITSNYQWISPTTNPTILDGTVTVTYDSYGTLILPNGTYNNVVRVHYQDNYSQAQGTYTVDYGAEVSYRWYINGNHLPIASVTIYTSTLQRDITSCNYINTIITSIHKDDIHTSLLSLFPNPTKNILNITSVYKQTLKNVEIIDGEGRLVLNKALDSNMEQAQIDVSEITKGTYVVKVLFIDGSAAYSKVAIE